MSETYSWWQQGVLYEIYPRSFQDTNGDGIGDIAGIRRRLDYLRWLGVTAIWLTPFYRSPMKDYGYDVADYCDVDPSFGSMADIEGLIADAHAAGLRVVFDFVPNHTSDQHEWFLESKASRDNPRRGWYIWRDPAPGGGPPNNWLSNIGLSAWTLDETTGQYYYHAFLKEQPDLNWRNPEVQEAMFNALRFWLDKGVDGFRIDVIWQLIKDDEFRDNPLNPEYIDDLPPHRRHLATYNTDRPEVHDIIARMREVIDEYEDRMIVGEIYLPLERLVTYYGASGSNEVHLPFNFQLLSAPWNATSIANLVNQYEASLPATGWPNWVLGNHDKPRIATRVGVNSARLAAMLLLTLRGTPTLYYGDELGMIDVAIPPDRVRDTFELDSPGFRLGRDGERTPMQWSAAENAGFSRHQPWLPVAPDYKAVNV
ncbi:MAG: alpha-amylase family glycosyl hydrolase, partial [Dehalococcoidia bacterium]